MGPTALHDLLFNLKLQFLALPSLARWGLLAFAGIVVMREVIDVGWKIYRRRSGGSDPEYLTGKALVSAGVVPNQTPLPTSPAALRAPDPLANRPMPPTDPAKVPVPVASTRREG